MTLNRLSRAILPATAVLLMLTAPCGAQQGSSGGAPRSKTNVPAFVRGYSTRTGKLPWTFHTILRLGEFGNDAWKDDSWQYTGNTFTLP